VGAAGGCEVVERRSAYASGSRFVGWVLLDLILLDIAIPLMFKPLLTNTPMMALLELSLAIQPKFPIVKYFCGELLRGTWRLMGMERMNPFAADRLLASTPQRRKMLKQTFLITSSLVILGAFTASGANAHIEPKPATVKLGAKVVVSFTVEHGCGTSPTTKLQIKVPEGVQVSHPTGPKSMVSQIVGNVVTFEGLAAGKNRQVSLTVQFPKTPGLVPFPVVQTCKVGKESWIQVPNEADPKPNFPAPQIMVK
jgi:periplasmic copper chaperone A